jgi:hypothetical protein
VLESATRLNFDGMSDGTKQMGEGALDIGRNAVNLTPVGFAVNASTDGALNKTLEKATDVGDSIIGGATQGAANTLTTVKDGVKNVGEDIGEGISDGAKEVGHDVATAGKEIGKDIVKVAGGAGKVLESATRLNFDGMSDGVTQMGEGALDIGRNAINLTPVGLAVNASTNDVLNKTLEKATDVGDLIIGGVTQGMASNLTAVKDGVKDVGEGIVTGNPRQILGGVTNAGLGALTAVRDFTPSGLASNVAMSTLGVAVNSLTGNSTDTSQDVASPSAEFEEGAEQYSEDLDLASNTTQGALEGNPNT